MIEIAFAAGLVLALIAVLLACYAAEGIELDQARRQPAFWDERAGQYLSRGGAPFRKAKGESLVKATARGLSRACTALKQR
jgi:hypothetical protein